MSVVLLVKEKIGPRSLGVILGDGMIEDEDDGYCYVCNVTTSSQLPFSMDNFGRRQRRASAETGGGAWTLTDRKNEGPRMTCTWMFSYPMYLRSAGWVGLSQSQPQ